MYHLDISAQPICQVFAILKKIRELELGKPLLEGGKQVSDSAPLG